jgi:hypothetical protein
MKYEIIRGKKAIELGPVGLSALFQAQTGTREELPTFVC